jgi:hypothetical protein
MKNVIPLLLFSYLIPFYSNAQVLEETRVMSVGSKPALTIVHQGADTKFVDSEWREFMKPYGRVAKVKQSKETMAQEVQILDIGGVNNLNIYNLNETTGDGVKSIVWFDLGSGFVNSTGYPKEYVASVKLLKDFAQKVKVDLITNDLETQQKQLSKFENNLGKLQREQDNLHKIIEDSKKRIAQAESDIEQNIKDQDAAQKEIDGQKNVVEGVKKKLDNAKDHDDH